MMKRIRLVLVTAALTMAVSTAAGAAPLTVTIFICGGGAAQKDLLALNAGQVFQLTDVTVANASQAARLIALFQGTFPPASSAAPLLVFEVPGQASHAQQYKTPIEFRGRGVIKVSTANCSADNLTAYITISGDLR
jgi:hypothetical protein